MSQKSSSSRTGRQAVLVPALHARDVGELCARPRGVARAADLGVGTAVLGVPGGAVGPRQRRGQGRLARRLRAEQADSLDVPVHARSLRDRAGSRPPRPDPSSITDRDGRAAAEPGDRRGRRHLRARGGGRRRRRAGRRRRRERKVSSCGAQPEDSAVTASSCRCSPSRSDRTWSTSTRSSSTSPSTATRSGT